MHRDKYWTVIDGEFVEITYSQSPKTKMEIRKMDHDFKFWIMFLCSVVVSAGLYAGVIWGVMAVWEILTRK